MALNASLPQEERRNDKAEKRGMKEDFFSRRSIAKGVRGWGRGVKTHIDYPSKHAGERGRQSESRKNFLGMSTSSRGRPISQK